MSWVTNILLSYNIVEKQIGDHKSEHLNVKLINEEYEAFGTFKEIGQYAGGKKHIETPLYAAAFNYFPIKEFMYFVFSLNWECPDDVQIFIEDQEEDRFKLIDKSNYNISTA